MIKTNSNYCFSLAFQLKKHLLKARKADKESSAKVETKGADAKKRTKAV
jgi:hypothetical protein